MFVISSFFILAARDWNPFQQLKITEGESSIRAYQDKNTESGNTLTRSFCTNCGSSLFAKPEKEYILIQPSAIEGGQAWGERRDYGNSCSSAKQYTLVPKKEYFPERRLEWLKDITFATEQPPL